MSTISRKQLIAVSIIVGVSAFAAAVLSNSALTGVVAFVIAMLVCVSYFAWLYYAANKQSEAIRSQLEDIKQQDRYSEGRDRLTHNKLEGIRSDQNRGHVATQARVDVTSTEVIRTLYSVGGSLEERVDELKDMLLALDRTNEPLGTINKPLDTPPEDESNQEIARLRATGPITLERLEAEYTGADKNETLISFLHQIVDVEENWNPWPTFKRGSLYLDSGNYDGAIDDFKGALLASKNYRDADKDLKDLVNSTMTVQQVSDSKVYALLGAAYISRGKAILDYFSTSIESLLKENYHPMYEDRFDRARIEMDKAIVSFEQALKLTPRHMVVVKALRSAYAYRAAAYHQLRKEDLAVNDFRQVIVLSKELGEYREKGQAQNQDERSNSNLH